MSPTQVPCKVGTVHNDIELKAVSEFRVQRFGCRVAGLGCLGFRVLGLGFGFWG